MIFYAALGQNLKLAQLITGGRMDDHKMKTALSQFFSSDFSRDDVKIKAIKNAVDLRKKKRYRESVTFYLLAGRLRHACNTCFIQMQDFQLALFVARVSKLRTDGRVERELWRERIFRIAQLGKDHWLASAAFWRMKRFKESLLALLPQALADDRRRRVSSSRSQQVSNEDPSRHTYLRLTRPSHDPSMYQLANKLLTLRQLRPQVRAAAAPRSMLSTFGRMTPQRRTTQQKSNPPGGRDIFASHRPNPAPKKSGGGDIFASHRPKPQPKKSGGSDIFASHRPKPQPKKSGGGDIFASHRPKPQPKKSGGSDIFASHRPKPQPKKSSGGDIFASHKTKGNNPRSSPAQPRGGRGDIFASHRASPSRQSSASTEASDDERPQRPLLSGYVMGLITNHREDGEDWSEGDEEWSWTGKLPTRSVAKIRLGAARACVASGMPLYGTYGHTIRARCICCGMCSVHVHVLTCVVMW